MAKLGFHASVGTPCLYYHKQRDIHCVAHVDDFLVGGDREQLDWFIRVLGEQFEIKSEILGSDKDEVRSAKFLGRTIRWTDAGIEYEGDTKLRADLLSEWGMEDCKSVLTPGEKEAKSEDQDDENDQREEMQSTDATAYRRGVAKINFMCQDRMDMGFASKELSKGMAKPRVGDEVGLKRAIRYLKGAEGCVSVFAWQDPVDVLEVYTDSDWAGCRRTRKSTSGGIMLMGTHVIGHWCKTQANVALSSGEAELNAALKGGCEALGVKTMSEELLKQLDNKDEANMNKILNKLAKVKMTVKLIK